MTIIKKNIFLGVVENKSMATVFQIKHYKLTVRADQANNDIIR